jgi:hypothetical protein
MAGDGELDLGKEWSILYHGVTDGLSRIVEAETDPVDKEKWVLVLQQAQVALLSMPCAPRDPRPLDEATVAQLADFILNAPDEPCDDQPPST